MAAPEQRKVEVVYFKNQRLGRFRNAHNGMGISFDVLFPSDAFDLNNVIREEVWEAAKISGDAAFGIVVDNLVMRKGKVIGAEDELIPESDYKKVH